MENFLAKNKSEIILIKNLINEYKSCIILLIFILIIGIFTIFGERGLIHLNRLMIESKRVETINNALKAENRALKKEIFLLKNNKEYLENIIRKEMGYVRKDETIYQFKK